jgi:hypothetical protein
MGASAPAIITLALLAGCTVIYIEGQHNTVNAIDVLKPQPLTHQHGTTPQSSTLPHRSNRHESEHLQRRREPDPRHP